VERLVLFHHAPEYSDERLDQTGREVREQFPDALLAYEGLQVDLATQTIFQPVSQAIVNS